MVRPPHLEIPAKEKIIRLAKRSSSSYQGIAELDLSITQISGSDDINSLAEEISKLTKLIHIDFSWNEISEDNLLKIIQSLKHCPDLKNIELEHSKLTASKLSELAQIISSFPNLEHINLSGHNFPKTACDGLLKIVSACPKLKSLGLDRSHLNLGHEGFKSLAEGILKLGREDLVITHKIRGSSEDLFNENHISDEFELLKSSLIRTDIFADSGVGIEKKETPKRLSAASIKLLVEKNEIKQTTL